MRSATVVLPVPGGPVKHMCRFGRGASRPNLCRARSTRSSSAMSSIHRFTGTRPTRSRSSAPSTSSMLAASRSSANMTRASGESRPRRRSGWPFQAVGARRRANDPGTGWAAGRRVGVLDIPRRPKAGITGTISRFRPGSIRLESQTDSGLKPREPRLSGLVWCHAFQIIKAISTSTTTMPVAIANHRWLNHSQAINRAAETARRSTPSTECLGRAVRIDARVDRRLTSVNRGWLTALPSGRVGVRRQQVRACAS